MLLIDKVIAESIRASAPLKFTPNQRPQLLDLATELKIEATKRGN
jgi:hypothetical protein